MSNVRYRVNPGCTILHKVSDGQSITLTPGTVFKKGEEISFKGKLYPPFPQKAIDEFIKNEFVAPLDWEFKEDPNKEFQEFRPGENPTPLPVPGANTRDKNFAIDADKAVVTGGPEPLKVSTSKKGVNQTFTPPPAQEPITQKSSIWDTDPAGLKDKDLETLNIMILERDTSANPVATVEEAIQQLSKDFKSEK